MPYKPLISIITVCYNADRTIERTIESVLGQSYNNIEYIIIDGNSSDGTVEIIKNYEKRIAYWVSEKDEGIYYAINKGLTMAHGEYIGILNSDDWYELNAIETIVEYLSNNRNIEIIDGVMRTYKDDLPQLLIGNYFENMERGMPPHPTCFVKNAVYERLGMYDIRYKSAADYEFLLRCKINGIKFLCIPHVLANFSMGGISSSLVSVIETTKINREYGFISQPYMRLLLLLYYLRDIFRKLQS
jgi:glycosyltransferase involved in cell wall biosynthesis